MKWKQKVLNSFMTTDGKLRIVIATMAFSIGVDIQNIIHYGPPTDVVQYVQETRGLVEMEFQPLPCCFTENWGIWWIKQL